MYLDPGFGGMLIQIIVALIATGGAIIFALRRKIKALFSKKGNTDISAAATTGTTTPAADDAVDMLSDDR